MVRLRDDSGLSLTELVVVIALMGFVLAVVYMGQQFAYRAQDTADRQNRITQDITAPIRAIDKSFSQSLVPPFGTNPEPYHALLRMPVDYMPGQTYEYDYLATTDGRIVEAVYRIAGTTRTKVREAVLTSSNANRTLNVPLFTYYKGSTVTTNVITADSVVVEVASTYQGTTYRDKRRISFRNR